MNQVPILFIGDSPSVQSGLSRIGRDLAILTSRMEEFRVGYLGRGGLPSRRFPFMQYTFNEVDQWGEGWLEPVWNDFAGNIQGIVFTIWDPSRLMWFGNPIGMPNERWLRNAPFQKWGYFAVDSYGAGGRLSAIPAATVAGYDRVLAYSTFGSSVLEKTLNKQIDYIPHGVNMETFMPRDGQGVRLGMEIPETTLLVGCVMTNQARKDWPLAFETIAILREQMPIRAWFKVDSLDRYWDLRALATDLNLGGEVILDVGECSDNAMSYFYSACDATFLPSLGEGFGYPIAESLACGVPCVHGSYGAGAELIADDEWIFNPVAHRYDTRYNCIRPVYDPVDVAGCLLKALTSTDKGGVCRDSISHLNWPNLYTVWEKWFREGLK